MDETVGDIILLKSERDLGTIKVEARFVGKTPEGERTCLLSSDEA